MFGLYIYTPRLLADNVLYFGRLFPGQCVYFTYKLPNTDGHTENLAVKTEPLQEGTSDYYTHSQPSHHSPTAASDAQQTAEPTPGKNTHSSIPETSSAVLQNTQPVFPRLQSRTHIDHHDALQETPLPSTVATLSTPIQRFNKQVCITLAFAIQFFVELVETEVIPNVFPTVWFQQYPEAVVYAIPREPGWLPNVPPPPIIRHFNVGVPGPDPGGTAATDAANDDDNSYYNTEMAKYCTEEATVTEIVPRT